MATATINTFANGQQTGSHQVEVSDEEEARRRAIEEALNPPAPTQPAAPAGATTTGQEIEEQRRQLVSDLASTGYRQEVASATANRNFNQQAQAAQAYADQAASDINAPDALRTAMALQSQYYAAQGDANLNNSAQRYRDYSAASEGENRAFFDRLGALVPLYEQALAAEQARAAAEAAARGGGGRGGGGGGSGGSDYLGGYLNSGLAEGELAGLGWQGADQRFGQRTAAAHRGAAGFRDASNKSKQITKKLSTGAQRGAGRKLSAQEIRQQQRPGSGFTTLLRQGPLPSSGGASTVGPHQQRSAAPTPAGERQARGIAALQRMDRLVNNLAAESERIRDTQFNPAMVANYPLSNQRNVDAADWLVAQGLVDPVTARAVFANNVRPAGAEPAAPDPYAAAQVRQTPDYQEASAAASAYVNNAVGQGQQPTRNDLLEYLSGSGLSLLAINQLMSDISGALYYDG